MRAAQGLCIRSAKWSARQDERLDGLRANHQAHVSSKNALPLSAAHSWDEARRRSQEKSVALNVSLVHQSHICVPLRRGCEVLSNS